jgi:hypothetical protein
LDSGTDGTNTATVTSENADVLGAVATAPYAFGEPTTIEGYPEINVFDTNGESWTASADASWTYSKDFDCPTDPSQYVSGVHQYEHVNTATIDETGQADDATVTVKCYAPTVSKTASGSYDERHTWDIAKSVDPTSQSGFAGDTLSWTWTVTLSEVSAGENFAVSGMISVANPAGSPGGMSVALADQLNDGTIADLDCGGTLTVSPGTTGTCPYSVSPVDASATLNTATATFNGIDFIATAGVSFTANLINGTAVVDDDQEPDFPLTLNAGEGPWQWTETQSDECAAAGSGDYSAGTYSVTLNNIATVTASNGQSDSASASTTYICYEPAKAQVVKTTTEGDDDIGQFPFVFVLSDPTGAGVETQTLGSGGGTLVFASELRAEGTWTVTEMLPDGWVSTTGLACTFEVAYPASAGQTYECSFDNMEKSRLDLLKLTNGLETTTQTWSFAIYEGPDGFGGSEVASDATPDALLEFGAVDLSPLETYTLCELGVPAGYSTFWQIDTDSDGIGDVTVVPYNPNADDDPPEDLGNRCVDLGAGTNLPLAPGTTLSFIVDNQQPGGGPRTPGYWKNWNTCTGGNQQYTADANGGWQEGFWLLEDVLDPAIGGGVVWDDILTDGFLFPITTCEVAVDILDKREVDDPAILGDGKKKASDPLVNLATHLMAAQLNFGAGACTTQEVLDTALEAEMLLDGYDFDGTAGALRKKSDDSRVANELAAYLDAYNNGELCGDSIE